MQLQNHKLPLTTSNRVQNRMHQPNPSSRMTFTMIHFSDHSLQLSKHKDSMMLLTQIILLEIMIIMNKNYSKKNNLLFILYWLLLFRQTRGENLSKNLMEMQDLSFQNYTIIILSQMLHNMRLSL